MKRLAVTDIEVRSLLWAYEELVDFYEMDEANLNEEEMPTERYRDILTRLRRVLLRCGFQEGQLPKAGPSEHAEDVP